MENEFDGVISKVYALYCKYGIKSVTMDDVASELGSSKKTLYQYVNDKEHLVRLTIEYEAKLRAKHFRDLFAAKRNAILLMFDVHRYVNNMLRNFNPSMSYDLRKYYPAIFKDFSEKKRDGMMAAVKANLMKGKEEGLYRAELDVDSVAFLHVSRIMSMFESELFAISEYTSPVVFREVFIYHIRGIASPKGLKVLEENLDRISTY
ncbi:MAG: TetR/AcrR family transcriptional regulator [Bacteroidetes bacterium]|nr:TetR/AcrR family transcriptional regulator [Bacteroidota bacterium]MBU1719526.1 TetR/AcrR family transcriptional regulator [Bacteroidota bacterium]